MCAVDLRPPSIRSGVGFQYYMSGFNARWATEAVHSATFDKVLADEYVDAVNDVKAELARQKDYVKYGAFLSAQLFL